MKVFILGPAYPYRGGIAAFNERLAKEFIDNGHEVDILTFTLQYPNFLFPGKTQFSQSPKPENLHIERQISSINPISWIKVGRRIKREQPDIVLLAYWLGFMAPCLGTIARIGRSNKKTKIITLLHNLIPHEAKVWDKCFAKYMCLSSGALMTMSESVRSDVQRCVKDRPCALSPHPLYDHFGQKVSKQEACHELGLDESYKYILFFGLIRDYKGLDWLIESFAKSNLHRDKKVRLIVAGEFYSDGQTYHQLAEDLGIEDDIIWHTEFIADQKVRYYFSAADLIAQPYKSATQSGVTQIAYHFDKPMLVTKVGGLAEIVPNGRVGYAVEPNTEAISSALQDFYYNNPDFHDGILEEKKKYSWSAMVGKIIDLSVK